MDDVLYARAASPEAAVAAVAARPGAAFIGGGTALLDVMKDYVERHDALVDVNHAGLDRIEETEDGGLRIGALVRNAPMAMDDRIASRYPAIAQTILMAALPQIRNKATLGGNLMQRTRCSYFRDPAFACNKRAPGSGCPATDGLSRGHALLGGSEHCIASHASSLAVALVLYDAEVETRGPDGPRRFPLADLHLLPGGTPERETILAHGEMITHVALPGRVWFAHAAHAKVRDRFLYSNVQVVAALDLDGDTIRDARVALGGVATVPWRAVEAEDALRGAAPSARTFALAAQMAVGEMAPTPDNAFKIELTRRLVVRALAEIVQGAAS